MGPLFADLDAQRDRRAPHRRPTQPTPRQTSVSLASTHQSSPHRPSAQFEVADAPQHPTAGVRPGQPRLATQVRAVLGLRALIVTSMLESSCFGPSARHPRAQTTARSLRCSGAAGSWPARSRRRSSPGPAADTPGSLRSAAAIATLTGLMAATSEQAGHQRRPVSHWRPHPRQGSDSYRPVSRPGLERHPGHLGRPRAPGVGDALDGGLAWSVIGRPPNPRAPRGP